MRRLLRAHVSSGVALVIGVAIIAVLPLYLGAFQTRNMATVGIYFIAIIGLNIVTGYSGQISLGQGAFMGVGAYTTAFLATEHGVGVWWTIPVAALVAGVAGFLFGLPALRLHGPYLALGTFALAVAFVELVRSDRFIDVTGGSQGLFIGDGLPTSPYYQTWGIALGVLLFAWFILSGKFGRSLRAVRDAELAAISSGLNPAIFKTLAFGLAAAYAGVAGSLHRHRGGLRQRAHRSCPLSRSRCSWALRSAGSVRCSGRCSERCSSSMRRSGPRTPGFPSRRSGIQSRCRPSRTGSSCSPCCSSCPAAWPSSSCACEGW